jgi:hypothetical protein
MRAQDEIERLEREIYARMLAATIERMRLERRLDRANDMISNLLDCAEREMYVYKQTQPDLYTVGFYNPKGKWIAESDHPTDHSAARRVAWLNGSGPTSGALSGIEHMTENRKAVVMSADDLHELARRR